jgi:hypothetical protein
VLHDSFNPQTSVNMGCIVSCRESITCTDALQPHKGRCVARAQIDLSLYHPN